MELDMFIIEIVNDYLGLHAQIFVDESIQITTIVGGFYILIIDYFSEGSYDGNESLNVNVIFGHSTSCCRGLY